MFGLLASLQAGSGSQLVPVSCPVALVPEEQIADLHFGLIAPSAPSYAAYRTILEAALGSNFLQVARIAARSDLMRQDRWFADRRRL